MTYTHSYQQVINIVIHNYVKNKKGSFDWAEKSSFQPNWYTNVNYGDVSATKIAKGLHILFSKEYTVKPCYRDKNNNFKDL